MNQEREDEHQYYYNYMSELWEKKLTEEKQRKSCMEEEEPCQRS